jgi:hypothetical protein
MLRFGILNVTIKNGDRGTCVQGRRNVRRDDYLWSPEIPDLSYHLSELSVLDMHRQDEVFRPRVLCMFGGDGGELLPTIIKLTFWFVGFVLVGIEFHYYDTSTILGNRFPLSHLTTEEAVGEMAFEAMNGWHVDYTLDGPGGEIITGFSVPNETLICNLQVSHEMTWTESEMLRLRS